MKNVIFRLRGGDDVAMSSEQPVVSSCQAVTDHEIQDNRKDDTEDVGEKNEF